MATDTYTSFATKDNPTCLLPKLTDRFVAIILNGFLLDSSQFSLLGKWREKIFMESLISAQLLFRKSRFFV
jgi:hypothetical protein